MEFFCLGLKQLPFNQLQNQIIYVESEYNVEVNKYIQRNYNNICEKFKSWGYDFCYIPALIEELSDRQILKYYAPKLKDDDQINNKPASDFILKWMLHPENKKNIGPSLLFYHPLSYDSSYSGAVCQFIGFSLTPDSEYDKTNNLSNILKLIHIRICNYDSKRIRFHRVPRELDEDEKFDSETSRLMSEVRERIGKLRQIGIKRQILAELLQGYDKISRLYITKDLRILLKDYNDLEIKMDPLPKTLFILFLRHTEGIQIIDLDKFYDELIDIYSRMKSNPSTITKNIDGITQTTNRDRIYVHSTAIRKAFEEVFDEHLADSYCITGEKYTPRKITLDRKLIECEEDWILLPYR